MRDSDGNTVFVKNNGEYSYTFPEENIVSREDFKEYVVYFFIPCETERFGYIELSCTRQNKKDALKFASNIYGKEIELTNSVKGEVFEVEVHG